MYNNQMLHFQSFWNIMLATDSYKATHHNMLPTNLEYMESYAESRGGLFDETVFFGLQYYLKSYLVGKQVTEEKIQEAVKFYNEHFGVDNLFNERDWRYILEKYNGHLPIIIEAVKEGSKIKTKNILYKIKSTDKRCVWLVNWVETLLMKVWYPITISTNSYYGAKILEKHKQISGTENTNVRFSLHDFGYRGVASEEQAWIGGAAHLTSFMGSDTVAGIRMLQHYYNAPMCGFSVPASEHMVMTVRGRNMEIETYREIISKYAKGTKFENCILSLVSDTYNIYEVCKFLFSDEYIRKMLLERPGNFVIRPDSGDAKEVLIKCFEIFESTFGVTMNPKGYKRIHEKFKFLQGDGININSMDEILTYLEDNKWSIDNLIFGSGGGLLQAFDRDTLKFAIKASYAVIDGNGVDVYKDPITAKGGKKSKFGKLYLIKDEFTNEYTTINHYEYNNQPNYLIPVFDNGKLLVEYSYDDVKQF